MNRQRTISERIRDEVTSWPGIQAVDGDRGELSFRIERREIGHLHGDRAAHFGFPRPLWAELMDQGRIRTHPLNQPGWGERRIIGEDDIAEVVELLRLNYDRIVERHGVPLDSAK